MTKPTFWQGRHVLVTGATGMVGAWLVKELLAQDAYVVALVQDIDPHSEFYRSGDHQRTAIVNGQLEDYASLERAINHHEVDTVFHLGAQTIVGAANRSPLHTFEANIRGTYNLLEACRVLPTLVKRVVVASSDKAYGEHPSLPYTEEMALQGHHPYDVSKSCADLIAQSYFFTYQLPVTIARCGNIYGGGDLNWSRIVPGTIQSLLREERPVIRSNGKFVRDYIYVKDVTHAYMRLAECLEDDRVRGAAFNFSNEQPMTVLELVAAVQHLMGCDHLEPDIRNTAWGEIRDQHLSAAKALEILSWKPQYDTQNALQETIEWYRAYFAG
ncbi:MAG: GDP-mannose 4,6-dehydratase [Anaerolineae bacterium]|nr:GDP-mannose 4,6-dehydratase [Anaerolineae bacterium]